jgi:Alanine-zipper, major outer membrane lipoprotein
MSKKVAVVAAVMAVALLSGCQDTKRLDGIESRIGAVETTANNAASAAARAQQTADGAASAAAEAQKSANDAVEAVSRMAEKCCRK